MKKENKNDALLEKLVMLEAEEKSILRNLNTYYYNTTTKEKLYTKLKETRKDIQHTKFKLRMEREMKKNDRNNDTNS